MKKTKFSRYAAWLPLPTLEADPHPSLVFAPRPYVIGGFLIADAWRYANLQNKGEHVSDETPPARNNSHWHKAWLITGDWE